MSKNIRNRKNVVAIFAHPDDEAFGPAGTIAKLSQEFDVYLICATAGEVGQRKSSNLAKTRLAELKKSSKILGVKKVYCLGFIDGTLSNNLYHSLASKIEKRLRIIKPQTLITFEPRGISGHIDHITVSLVTTYVFYKLAFVKKLLYFCIGQKERSMITDYFIYFPPGYKDFEINEVFDTEDVWPQKRDAILVHRSQGRDGRRFLKLMEKLPKRESFLVLSKN